MRRVCAWCDKELGLSSIKTEKENMPITHGICGDCMRKTMSYKAKPLKDFLDQFSDPVFWVDSERRIVVANNEGLSVLHKKSEEISGKLGGDAFGCKYADLPGGCGNTVHCKTCTIRMTVTDTMQSGRSNIRIAAYPELHHITGERKIRFLISTEKIGEAVLLRIDNVTEENVPQQGAALEAEKPRR